MMIYISLDALAKMCAVITLAFSFCMFFVVMHFRGNNKKPADFLITLSSILLFTTPIASLYLFGYLFFWR